MRCRKRCSDYQQRAVLAARGVGEPERPDERAGGLIAEAAQGVAMSFV